jgi:hypothetical protein
MSRNRAARPRGPELVRWILGATLSLRVHTPAPGAATTAGSASRAWAEPASLSRSGPPGRHRKLQLALAALWLIDAVLQFQAAMFSQGFPRMLGEAAAGNPVVVAGPVRWSAHQIGQHLTAASAAFAAVQLLLALGIAWRPTVRAALAASIAWALAVWWLGEGLGGVLTPAGSPLTGGPGAAVLYAVAGLALWPAPAAGPSPFPAARALGVRGARLLWLLLWGGLAGLAVATAGQAAALAGQAGAMAAGQPAWLRSLDAATAALLRHVGTPASLVMAAVFGAIAAAAFAPRPVARAGCVAAVAVAAAMWATGQDFGGAFTGMATDLNSAPLLALLALAYWPAGGGARKAMPVPAATIHASRPASPTISHGSGRARA